MTEVNVQDLLKKLTVEELNLAAEEYWKQIKNWDYHLAKPFNDAQETSLILLQFSYVLQGIRPLQGMKILDFGVGSCWSSRFLTQLGLEVIAVDVSKTALKIGQELYERLPPIGRSIQPKFLCFDGYRLELPDQSIDRIMCLDAFHHVPNPSQVLKEFARVLKDGGIAGFAEPGPNHSKTPQSQIEMKRYTVIENDVIIQEIWRDAKQAGFTDIELAIFNPFAYRVNLKKFEQYVEGGQENKEYAQYTQNQMQNQRVFFLYKGGSEQLDSRQPLGLLAKLNISCPQTKVQVGSNLEAKVYAKNVGVTKWLPSSSIYGPVNLGVHLLDHKGSLIELDYHRYSLPVTSRDSIYPQEAVEFEISIPVPEPGIYQLEFDLVSEGVTWFNAKSKDSEIVVLEIEVLDSAAEKNKTV